MSIGPADIETLKARLKATWMSGDYAHFAKPMEPGALAFLARVAITPGSKMLDVGCGAGQIAIPAAKSGVQVTGVDIATNLIEQARSRAMTDGLTVRFDEGDAEALPYIDDSYDVVISLIGAMFAPRPEKVAAELVRVCRPGGRIIMANWTPEGFVGQIFKTTGKYAPPPPTIPSPLLWGNESTVRDRLQVGVSSIQVSKQQYPFHYPFGPDEVVEFFRMYYGPTNRAFASIDKDRQAALRQDLELLWSNANKATDGTTLYDAEYLEVIAIKAEAKAV